MGLVDGLWIWHTHRYEQSSIARGWEGIIRQEKRHNKQQHGLANTGSIELEGRDEAHGSHRFVLPVE